MIHVVKIPILCSTSCIAAAVVVAVVTVVATAFAAAPTAVAVVGVVTCHAGTSGAAEAY